MTGDDEDHVTGTDGDAVELPTANADSAAPSAPAMSIDHGLIVDVVKGSGAPPENKLASIVTENSDQETD